MGSLDRLRQRRSTGAAKPRARNAARTGRQGIAAAGGVEGVILLSRMSEITIICCRNGNTGSQVSTARGKVRRLAWPLTACPSPDCAHAHAGGMDEAGRSPTWPARPGGEAQRARAAPSRRRARGGKPAPSAAPAPSSVRLAPQSSGEHVHWGVSIFRGLSCTSPRWGRGWAKLCLVVWQIQRPERTAAPAQVCCPGVQALPALRAESTSSMSSVMRSRSYSCAQPQSRRALESSREAGHVSAIAWR